MIELTQYRLLYPLWINNCNLFFYILNKIIGEKISIVTEKSQTTRNSIYGIYNDDESQIVFIDTMINDIPLIRPRFADDSIVRRAIDFLFRILYGDNRIFRHFNLS